MLVLIVSFSGAIGLIAYWLGQQSQQIVINTGRITEIEKHDIDTREREKQIIIDQVKADAEVNARISVLEALMKRTK